MTNTFQPPPSGNSLLTPLRLVAIVAVTATITLAMTSPKDTPKPVSVSPPATDTHLTTEQQAQKDESEKQQQEAWKTSNAARLMSAIKADEVLLQGSDIDIRHGKATTVERIGLFLGVINNSAQALQNAWSGRDSLSPDDISHLRSFENKLSSFQQRSFPILRLAFKKAAGEKLWVQDVTLSVGGTGNTILTMYGFWFARNANIQASEETLHDLASQLRFKRLSFAIYEHARESTYYKLDTPADSVIGIYANGGFSRLSKK